jgi:hypothetical protein
MVHVRWFVALVPVLVIGCASAKHTPRGEYNTQLITEDEIVASRATNAFEAIQKLRGNFLSYRGETSFYPTRNKSMPTVYVDEQAFGEITILRSIPAMQIASIRLYRSWEATTKYGVGNMGGVIAITTRQ